MSYQRIVYTTSEICGKVSRGGLPTPMKCHVHLWYSVWLCTVRVTTQTGQQSNWCKVSTRLVWIIQNFAHFILKWLEGILRNYSGVSWNGEDQSNKTLSGIACFCTSFSLQQVAHYVSLQYSGSIVKRWTLVEGFVQYVTLLLWKVNLHMQDKKTCELAKEPGYTVCSLHNYNTYWNSSPN